MPRGVKGRQGLIGIRELLVGRANFVRASDFRLRREWPVGGEGSISIWILQITDGG